MTKCEKNLASFPWSISRWVDTAFPSSVSTAKMLGIFAWNISISRIKISANSISAPTFTKPDDLIWTEEFSERFSESNEKSLRQVRQDLQTVREWSDLVREWLLGFIERLDQALLCSHQALHTLPLNATVIHNFLRFNRRLTVIGLTHMESVYSDKGPAISDL